MKFICYFFFVSWTSISLGFHISLSPLNVEIHIPFGFIRIGWDKDSDPVLNQCEIDKKIFGIK